MNQNDQVPNSNPNMNTMPPVRPVTPQPGEGSVGPVIGTIVILAIIVLGGLYFWGRNSGSANNAPAVATSTDGTINATSTDATSTTTNLNAGIEYHGS